MQELKLDVNQAGWRVFAGRKSDPAFRPVARRVFQRDDYTCQTCGFQAKEYQDVINIDGNYSAHKLENMLTVCCFCSQCLFLESVGMEEDGGGTLVYLPEMSQADLNSFCHVLFCAMGNGTNYEDSAQSIYRSLKFRSQPIETKFGVGTSQPQVFGQLILEYEANNPGKKIGNLLDDLRLLPSYTKFRVQLEAWAVSALDELS